MLTQWQTLATRGNGFGLFWRNVRMLEVTRDGVIDLDFLKAELRESRPAIVAIMAAEIWKTTPFAALIILAGLQAISDDLYDAAGIDGATAWQKFRHVTLPLVRPALLLALLFRTIDALRVFDLVFVMTQGGPADTTNVLQFYGYKKTFAEGMVGYGSAIAVAVFLISLVLSLAYLRILKTSRLEGATG